MDAFKPEERSRVIDILLDFTYSKDQGSYLVDQIGHIQGLIEREEADLFQKHMILIFKFLFRRKCEKAQTKIRVDEFDEASLKPHGERFVKKVYDEHVAAFRRKMYDLMMNDEPLVQEEPFHYEDKEEEKYEESSSVNKPGQGPLSAEPSQQSLEEIAPGYTSNKTKELQTQEYLALSSIKEKARAHRIKEIDYNDRMLTEYVKFLIGQTRNPHFAVRRSDFAQTHELHQKTLSVLTFDEYAKKDDDAMKSVTNDILQKSQFNDVIRQHTDPIAEQKFADDPKYNYFIKCKKQLTPALPLLAKVVNKQLTLYNYRLESAHSHAFAKTCQIISSRINTSGFLTKILFDNCGLADIDFAELLKGISKL